MQDIFTANNSSPSTTCLYCSPSHQFVIDKIKHKLTLKTVMQILSEPDNNSHLHKFNLTSGRFIIRYESNTEEYNYVRCVKTFLLQELMAFKSLLFLTPPTIRPLIGGILNRKLKVGLSASDWTEMTFVA